jgi:hypothetical protein
MMRGFRLLLVFLIITACSGDDNNPNCNFLIDVNVNATINLNLPLFNPLLFNGETVILNGQGNGGILLYRLNSETILAWDMADPANAVNSCPAMTLIGIELTSSCAQGYKYEIVTGQSIGSNPSPCTLKAYRVQPLGNNSFIITD